VRNGGLAALGCPLMLAACAAASPAPPTVASLPITAYSLHTVSLKPKLARVRAGSEFSVVANATDGPMRWELSTAGLGAIVEAKGSAPVGSCGSPPAAGCALPQRYTFLARARGTTTMVWTEYALACPGEPPGGCKAVIQPIRLTVT
jgi:hypothetical protein